MEQADDLKAFLRDWIENSHYDLARVEKSWSNQADVLCIFTGPHDWLAGYQAIMDRYKVDLSEVSNIQVKVENLEAYTEGSVGWIAARPEFVLPDGKEIPVRFTAVLHQENGEWKFVQYHVSAAVSDEDFLGRDISSG